MAVDKILELDLSNLTQEGLQMIDEQLGSIEDELKKAGKKPKQKKREKQTKKRTENQIKDADKKAGKKKEKEAKEQKKQNQKITQEFATLQKNASPAAIISQVKSAAPVLAPVFIATGLFTAAILKSDEIAKKFVDSADTRINLFVDRQEQALIDNLLQQVIYTTAVGSTSPRDSYNSFNINDRQITQDAINSDLYTLESFD